MKKKAINVLEYNKIIAQLKEQAGSESQLLSLTLFGLYKSGSKDFVKKYTEFLSCGGSKSPSELVGIFGFDIEDDKFWKYGIDEVKKILDEFNKIAKDVINKRD